MIKYLFFRSRKIILYSGILFLLFPKTAQAYLDPGTGSYFFQMLIGGLLGFLFFIKTIIKKVKELIRSISSKEPIAKKATGNDENK